MPRPALGSLDHALKLAVMDLGAYRTGLGGVQGRESRLTDTDLLRMKPTIVYPETMAHFDLGRCESVNPDFNLLRDEFRAATRDNVAMLALSRQLVEEGAIEIEDRKARIQELLGGPSAALFVTVENIRAELEIPPLHSVDIRRHDEGPDTIDWLSFIRNRDPVERIADITASIGESDYVTAYRS